MKIYDRRMTGMKFIICSVCAVWVVMRIAFAQEGQSPPKIDPKPPVPMMPATEGNSPLPVPHDPKVHPIPPVLVPLPGPQPVPGPKMDPIPLVPVPLPGPVIIRDFPPYVPDDPNDRDFPLPVPDDPNDDEGELPTPEELYRTPLSPEAMKDIVTEFQKKYTITTNREGIPLFIEGDLTPSNTQGDTVNISYAFFEENKDLFQMNNPRKELIVEKVEKSEIRGLDDIIIPTSGALFKQVYKGVEVLYGGVSVAFTPDNRIKLINNFFKYGIKISTIPAVSRQAAAKIAVSDLENECKKKVTGVINPRKLVYSNIYRDKGTYHLVWEMMLKLQGGFGAWKYVIDAHSGDILDKGNYVPTLLPMDNKC